MSTTTPATTQAASDAAGTLAGIIIMLAGAVAVALFLAIRGWEPRRIAGPLRYPPDQPLGRPILLAIIATCLYICLQALAGMALIVNKQMADGQLIAPLSFSPGEFAFLVTVPGILAAGLLLLTPLIWKGISRQLGFAFSCLPHGVIKGFIGSIIAIPLVFCSLLVLELVYKAINYEHPQAHDLLAMMRQTTNPLIRLALIAGAVAVAPLVEELVFRGFIQSALVRIFSRCRYQLPPLPTMPLSYETPPLVTLLLPASVPMQWLAIVLTSLAFASLHPMWTWPPIFLLSLCLGYAYERTGNLWTNITIHLLFNATSTAVFLMTTPV